MTIKHKKSRAFSLIELSIVILVVAILVAGVFQSKNLVNKYKLYSARSLTNSSPVSSVKDLLLWYETSLEESFSPSEAVEDGLISTWKDINPQTSFKNDAYAQSSAYRPTFVTNAANGLPVVRFTGSDDLFYPGQGLINSDYTAFVVEQRSSALSSTWGANPILGSVGSPISSDSIILRYIISGGQYIQFGNSFYFPYAPYSERKLVIHSLLFSKTKGKEYYASDGRKTSYRRNVTQNDQVITNNVQTTIGSRGNRADYFLGDIAEIIMFNRSLKSEERESIEKYLGKKYGIKIYENLNCPNGCDAS